MRDSDTYLAIIDEGEVRGIRRTLLSFGRERFREPDEKVLTSLQAINDLRRLDRLSKRMVHVGSWEELLASL